MNAFFKYKHRQDKAMVDFFRHALPLINKATNGQTDMYMGWRGGSVGKVSELKIQRTKVRIPSGAHTKIVRVFLSQRLMLCWLAIGVLGGSATLLRLTFLGEKRPEFPMGQIPIATTKCIKRKYFCVRGTPSLVVALGLVMNVVLCGAIKSSRFKSRAREHFMFIYLCTYLCVYLFIYLLKAYIIAQSTT